MAWKKWYRRSSKRRSSSYKRARGNLKSAYNQSDTITFVCSSRTTRITTTPQAIEVKQEGTTTGNILYGGGCILSVLTALRKSDNFRAMSPLYDQYKVTGIKAKVTWMPLTATAQNKGFTAEYYTAWDRTGYTYPTTAITDALKTADINSKITGYSSVIKQNGPIMLGSNVTRYIYPRLMAEKSQYLDTDTYGALADNAAEETDPNNLAFNPIFLLGYSSLDQNLTYKLDIEWKIVVSFRGAKK